MASLNPVLKKELHVTTNGASEVFNVTRKPRHLFSAWKLLYSTIT